MYRRAEMGIGTLIIFIALLLVAAIAAGVLIQSSGSLQEKALTTGDQAEGQIATNVRIVEVSATDGRDGEINLFNQLHPPSASRFSILRELPLTQAESGRLAKVEQASRQAGRKWSQIAHLPFMLVTARKTL